MNGSRKVISLQLEDDVFLNLSKMAKAEGRSIASMVRQILKKQVEIDSRSVSDIMSEITGEATK
jgi:hypothetical protein